MQIELRYHQSLNTELVGGLAGRKIRGLASSFEILEAAWPVPESFERLMEQKAAPPPWGLF